MFSPDVSGLGSNPIFKWLRLPRWAGDHCKPLFPPNKPFAPFYRHVFLHDSVMRICASPEELSRQDIRKTGEGLARCSHSHTTCAYNVAKPESLVCRAYAYSMHLMRKQKSYSTHAL